MCSEKMFEFLKVLQNHKAIPHKVIIDYLADYLYTASLDRLKSEMKANVSAKKYVCESAIE